MFAASSAANTAAGAPAVRHAAAAFNRSSRRRRCPWAARNRALALWALSSYPGIEGFRVVTSYDDENMTFVPYERGFVGRIDDPFTTFTRERTNEGAANTPAQPNIYGTELFLTQECPIMVGPLRDGQFYCTSAVHGYCDRRSGTCMCNTGYQGSGCQDCSPSHYGEGGLCYPKKLCPRDCSRAGSCDVSTGRCLCDIFRTGDDCADFVCKTLFDPLCTACTNDSCVACVAGHSLLPHGGGDGGGVAGSNNGAYCEPCYRFDPRCVECDSLQCLTCADPLLMSTRRSGRRVGDPLLPEDEMERQLTWALPFGTQDPHFFDDAEDFRVVRSIGDYPLNDSAVSCDQVGAASGGGAAWSCHAVETSHVVCGHAGTFNFMSPTYRAYEGGNGSMRVTVWRTGGGAYDAWVEVELEHVTTNASDVSFAAPRGSSAAKILSFPSGVLSSSFLVTLHEDGEVEQSERFDLVLTRAGSSGSSSVARLGAQLRAAVTLVDDDAGRTDPTLTNVTGAGLWAAVAGETANFTISAFLAAEYGNASTSGGPAPAGGDSWVVALRNAAGERARGSVADLADGNYSVIYTVETAVPWTIRVLLATAGGLRGDYFADPVALETPVTDPISAAVTDTADGSAIIVSRIDRSVDFAWGFSAPAGGAADFFAVRWAGALRARSDGATAFFLTFPGAGPSNGLGLLYGLRDNGSTNASFRVDPSVGMAESISYWGPSRDADGRAQLWIDGELVAEAGKPDNYGGNGGHSGHFDGFGTANLSMGHLHLIRLEYTERRGTSGIRLEWEPLAGSGGGGGGSLREVIPPGRLFWLREVGGSPWEAIVSPSVADAAASEAIGSGLFAAIAGQRATFAVVPRDEFGNRRFDPAVINGSCSVTAGSNISSYDGYHYSAAAAKLATAAFAANYSGYGSSSCPTEPMSPGGDFLVAELRLLTAADAAGDGGVGASRIAVDLWFDAAAGVIRGSYVPQISGQHRLNVTLRPAGTYRDDPLPGSPFPVEVGPGVTAAVRCDADGPALIGTRAGVATNLTITARDAFGNRHTTSSGSRIDPFEAVMLLDSSSGGSSLTAGSRHSGSQSGKSPERGAVLGSVVPLGNGVYRVQFLPVVAGSYVVSATLNGAAVADGPWTAGSLVIPAEAEGSTSPAWGTGLSAAVATVESKAWVQPRDGFGNNLLTWQNSTVSAWLRAPVDGTGRAGDDIVAQITYGVNSSSVALLRYTPLAVGTSELTVLVNGRHVRGSPFAVTVAAGPAAGANATASGLALTAAVAGIEGIFELQARDSAGNPTDRDSANFNVTLVPLLMAGSGGTTIVGAAEPLGGGRYRAVYNATEAGTYYLVVTEMPNGMAVIGSPFSVTVRPAGAWAPATLASWDRQTAGRSRVVLQAVDVWGNHIPIGGDIFRVAWLPAAAAAAAAGGNAAIDEAAAEATVTDSGDGSYVVKAGAVADRVAGDYAMLLWCREPGGLWIEYSAALDLTAMRSWHGKAAVNFDWGLGAPMPLPGEPGLNVTASNDHDSSWDVMPADYFSVSFSGFVAAQHDEEYAFYVLADDSAAVRLVVGGIVLLEDEGAGGAKGSAPAVTAAVEVVASVTGSGTAMRERAGSVRLAAGALATAELFYSHTTDAAAVRLEWSSPSTPRQVIQADRLYHERFGWSKNLSVLPSAVSAPESVAAGSGLSAATAGIPSWFLIEARDGYGNTRRAGGDAVTAFGRLSGVGTVFRCDVSDLGYGSYNVTYVARVAGVYALSVLLTTHSVDANVWDLGSAAVEAAAGGNDVSGSPFRLVAAPAAAAAAGSTATGSGLTQVTAGALFGQSIFEVTVGDAFGNRRATGGDAAGIAISFAWAGNTAAAAAASNVHEAAAAAAATSSVFITELGGGRYSVSYNVTRAGAWALSVTVAGSHVPGSPFALHVSAGPSYAAACTCEGCEALAKGMTAGETATLALVARDEWGNPVEGGGEAWAVELRGEEALGGGYGGYRGVATAVVTAAGSGSGGARYSLDVKPPAAGRYELWVKLARRRNHDFRPPAAGGGGLMGLYYADTRRVAAPVSVQIDAGPLSHDWGLGAVAGSAADYASVVWTGYLTAGAASSSYDQHGPVPTTYSIEIEADDAARVWVGGQLVAEADTADALTGPTAFAGRGGGGSSRSVTVGEGTVLLAPGRLEPLRVEYVERVGAASVALLWQRGRVETPRQLVPEAYLYPEAELISGGVVPFVAAAAVAHGLAVK